MSLLEGYDIEGSTILGDKAFGTVEILGYILDNNGEAVIPPKQCH